ncbi:MAG: lipoprotein [Deltaproteobacteria bacterium]
MRQNKGMLEAMNRYAVIGGLCLALILSAAGCGRKGPPLPPQYEEPPAVGDLQYQIKDDTVALRWSAPVLQNQKKNSAAGVRLYRSRTSLKESGCKNCPPVFLMIRSIPLQTGVMQYTERLEHGYRYTYKVVLVDSNHREGADSNIVRFVYE